MIGQWLRRRRRQQYRALIVASIPLATDDELRSHLCLETDPDARLALSLALQERVSVHDTYEHLSGRHKGTWTGVRAYCGEDTGPQTAPITEPADQ